MYSSVHKMISQGFSFRDAYSHGGAAEYYTTHGSGYRNPHERELCLVLEEFLKRHSNTLDFSEKILDLACGSGEVTSFLLSQAKELSIFQPLNIDACDPYTGEAYLQRIGRNCSAASFEDIEGGELFGSIYGLCIVSFALHLVQPSRLHNTCMQLALVSRYLFVISPHKKPIITSDMGFNIVDEFIVERVHGRFYKSSFL
mmetsp:Transcript_26994/g.44065  ORF Transcript_26994/g.44065 Transcript_26994/m.44065 type:complete len:200 (-) Transcript_26994:226-825(-)